MDSFVSAGSLQAISAGCLCRMSLQLNPLNPLESFLKQLGCPGILAPQSYLTVLWVSWAPRVSRVSQALLILIISIFSIKTCQFLPSILTLLREHTVIPGR